MSVCELTSRTHLGALPGACADCAQPNRTTDCLPFAPWTTSVQRGATLLQSPSSRCCHSSPTSDWTRWPSSPRIVAAAKLDASPPCVSSQSAWFAPPTVSGCPSCARHDADVCAPKLFGYSTALL